MSEQEQVVFCVSLVFHLWSHRNHRRLSMIRCTNIMCTDIADGVREIANTVKFTPDVEVFSGELAVDVDHAGHFHMLFRRVFGQVNFVQIISCSCDADYSVLCVEKALASGTDVGVGLGDNCLAVKMDGSFVALWRSNSSLNARMRITFCPSFPTPCSLDVRHEIELEGAVDTPLSTHGRYGYVILAQDTRIHALYSVNVGEASHPHMWTCDGACTDGASGIVRVWPNMPARVLTMTYSGEVEDCFIFGFCLFTFVFC
jgi:hypothetical protein